MGIIINNVETVQQAEEVVRTMRYMPQRDSRFPTPRGVRGTAGNAPWFWGVSGAEYRRRADLWPLNPEGELLFWAMIETVEGVRNADAIAQVPGVGGFYLGAGGDLSNSLGVPNATHPDVGAAVEKILGCVATSGLRRQDGPPLASTVPGPPSCPATIRSNGASSNPPSSSSAFGGTCGMP